MYIFQKVSFLFNHLLCYFFVFISYLYLFLCKKFCCCCYLNLFLTKYFLLSFRCFSCVFTLAFTVLLSTVLFSEAAPAFKFKKIFRTYETDTKHFPSKSERRFGAAASPIHFITPFVGVPQSMPSFNNFFAPQASVNSPASSSIYKLPLRLYNNGKPHAVFHGFPKPQNVVEYLPQAMSNIIRLPLKYISNAKPVGVYFKDPAFNYL